MKKILLTLATVVALSLGLSGAASADTFVTIPVAGSSTAIVDAGTDAMGGDSVDNRNREYLTIKNTGLAALDITGWMTRDAWAQGDTSTSHCNTFKVKTTNVDASLVSGATVMLPAGHTLRVYTGAGTAGAFGPTFHRAFMNSHSHCGANGHYITNNGDDLYFVDDEDAVQAHVKFGRQGGYEASFS